MFNFGEENRTITLAEKNKAEAGGVFAQHCIKLDYVCPGLGPGVPAISDFL